MKLIRSVSSDNSPEFDYGSKIDIAALHHLKLGADNAWSENDRDQCQKMIERLYSYLDQTSAK